MAGSLLLLLSLSGLPAPAPSASAQTAMEAAAGLEPRLGYSQDWSSKHRLMPGPSTEVDWSAERLDPRFIHNLLRRQRAVEKNGPAAPPIRHRRKIDWSVSLENGYVTANQFPAKYNFNIGVENCADRKSVV